MQLSALRLFVRDLAQARQFYRSVLGLPLLSDGSAHGYCVFRSAGIDIVVEAVPADAPADEQQLVGRFAGISFRVPDIEASHRALLDQGVAFSGAPERQAWGGWLATLLDPAGNQLQLVQHP